MITLTLPTGSREEIRDLTPEVQQALAASGLAEGAVLVSVPHCTCAVYLNENEPGLLADTLSLLHSLASAQSWRHDRLDDNADAHLGASLLGHAILVPVEAGRLVLGTWQRVLLVELDGPRHRKVQLTFLAAAGE